MWIVKIRNTNTNKFFDNLSMVSVILFYQISMIQWYNYSYIWISFLLYPLEVHFDCQCLGSFFRDQNWELDRIRWGGDHPVSSSSHISSRTYTFFQSKSWSRIWTANLRFCIKECIQMNFGASPLDHADPNKKKLCIKATDSYFDVNNSSKMLKNTF